MLYISGGLKPPEPHPYKTKILATALSRRNRIHIKQKKLFIKSFLFFVYGIIFSVYIKNIYTL
jgi:hypothetical protein